MDGILAQIDLSFVLWAIVIGFGLGVAAWLYFLPTTVARARRHPQATAILILNIFLGWTFLGWVAALVWAFTVPRQAAADRA
ncbi:superinfection immunity protein [Microvirga brassicacearum]|uniref:Superinfection immunity protein n=1 Tax=Microvirga brassicacearum TaxID=2580413 RepID=A0A5N3PHA6_9HYPH|nr:superinfection immunity protein [Microvirga brassicacearum]KAB0269035.1 superinfection immunity protein [Microvirga brassicacearum]